jgi:hypothetical protein
MLLAITCYYAFGDQEASKPGRLVSQFCLHKGDPVKSLPSMARLPWLDHSLATLSHPRSLLKLMSVPSVYFY